MLCWLCCARCVYTLKSWWERGPSEVQPSPGTPAGKSTYDTTRPGQPYPYCLTLDTVLVLRSGASTLPSLSLGKKEAVTASGRGVRSKEAALRMQQQPGAWELELERERVRALMMMTDVLNR